MQALKFLSTKFLRRGEKGQGENIVQISNAWELYIFGKIHKSTDSISCENSKK